MDKEMAEWNVGDLFSNSLLKYKQNFSTLLQLSLIFYIPIYALTLLFAPTIELDKVRDKLLLFDHVPVQIDVQEFDEQILPQTTNKNLKDALKRSYVLNENNYYELKQELSLEDKTEIIHALILIGYIDASMLTVITEIFKMFTPLLLIAIIKSLIECFFLATLTYYIARQYIGIHKTAFQTVSVTFNDFRKLLLISLGLTIIKMVGYLFFVVPGILISIMYSVLIPAVVIEGLIFKQAFKRSGELTKQLWSKIFLVLVAIFLIEGAVRVVLSSLTSVNTSEQAYLTYMGIELIIISILAPFVTIPIVLLYFNLRGIKENYNVNQLKEDVQNTTKEPNELF